MIQNKNSERSLCCWSEFLLKKLEFAKLGFDLNINLKSSYTEEQDIEDSIPLSKSDLELLRSVTF